MSERAKSIAVLSLATCFSFGADFFVAPNGDDNGKGLMQTTMLIRKKQHLQGDGYATL